MPVAGGLARREIQGSNPTYVRCKTGLFPGWKRRFRGDALASRSGPRWWHSVTLQEGL